MSQGGDSKVNESECGPHSLGVNASVAAKVDGSGASVEWRSCKAGPQAAHHLPR